VVAGQSPVIPALLVGSLAPSLIGDHSLKIPRTLGVVTDPETGTELGVTAGVTFDPLWVADFAYVPTWTGTVYVAFAFDVFSPPASSAGWPPPRIECGVHERCTADS
jgi:hypothetical protein